MSAASLTKNLRKTVRSGRIERTRLPLCPDISLYLISSDYPRGPLDYDEMISILNAPAYWAFCWASGQVLAGHILRNEADYAVKTVVDL
ncbi:MAG: methyltransferase type 12, partial [Pseudomonadales bacterium]|nr:methyltransferase type 12 [Pseudomonadales bacterium]